MIPCITMEFFGPGCSSIMQIGYCRDLKFFPSSRKKLCREQPYTLSTLFWAKWRQGQFWWHLVLEILPRYQKVWTKKVMHVVFYDIDKEKIFSAEDMPAGMHYCNEVVMMDAHDNAEIMVPGVGGLCGLMNHEVFHTFGLCHSFYCDNECKGIDIDPNKECHSNPCFNDCGGPHGSTCNNWDSGSQNIMGYNAER